MSGCQHVLAHKNYRQWCYTCLHHFVERSFTTETQHKNSGRSGRYSLFRFTTIASLAGKTMTSQPDQDPNHVLHIYIYHFTWPLSFIFFLPCRNHLRFLRPRELSSHPPKPTCRTLNASVWRGTAFSLRLPRLAFNCAESVPVLGVLVSFVGLKGVSPLVLDWICCFYLVCVFVACVFAHTNRFCMVLLCFVKKAMIFPVVSWFDVFGILWESTVYSRVV